MNESLIKEIEEHLNWYHSLSNHDNDFNVNFKEESVRLFNEVLSGVENDE